VNLPPEIDAALAREARRARKPKAEVLLRAVESYLENAPRRTQSTQFPATAENPFPGPR